MNTINLLKTCKKIGVIALLSLYLSTVVYASEPDHIIRGTQGNDDLRGTSFSDEIYGGKGDDIIYGGGGADSLFGGTGADQFVIKASELDSVDTIKDFNPDEGDTIILTFRSPSIKNMSIPKELGAESVKLDKNGNFKILMSTQEWLTLINLQNTNMYFEVENDSSFIRFVFKKDF